MQSDSARPAIGCDDPDEGDDRPDEGAAPSPDEPQSLGSHAIDALFRKHTGDTRQLSSGQQLGGYRLERPLGRGAMGIVWLAEDCRMGESVALKFLPTIVTGDPEGYDRLVQEAKALRKLEHGNIVRLFILDRAEDFAFLVMEYLRGPTLQTAIGRYKQRGDSAFPVPDIEWVLEQVAPALDYAHGRGLLHLDLKPSNLMLSAEADYPLRSGSGVLKLTDFGISFGIKNTLLQVSQDSVELGGNGSGRGTPGYMAPEMILGKKPTRATDIYSLGATLYHLAVGRAPFTTGDISYQTLQARPAPPGTGVAAVDETILRCLEKDPASRPASAEHVLREMRRRPIGITNFVPDGLTGSIRRFLGKKPGHAPLGCRPLGNSLGSDSFAIRVVHEQTGIVFRLLEPGEFRIGSPDEYGRTDEHPRYKVLISRRFYVAETPITVAQWRVFEGQTNYKTCAERMESGITLCADGRWRTHKKARWDNPIPQLEFELHGTHPVTQVTWNDVQEFCKHYTFRLPTEAEWEYACRAGTESAYWWGDDPNAGRKCGKFCDQSFARKFGVDPDFPHFPFESGFIYISPVKSFRPNAWGLHDMHGNVLEWCADKYNPAAYESQVKRDPLGLEGSKHVIRGGSFASGPDAARAAYRHNATADHASVRVGFRPIIGF